MERPRRSRAGSTSTPTAPPEDKLRDVYYKYELKYGPVVAHRPPAVPASGRGKKKVWGKIFGTSTATPSSSTQTPVLQGGWELAKYLNSAVLATNDDDDDDDFDILQWWQEKRSTYPVLSILARDVLSVHVSTVSSESDFSLAGRIIDDTRTSLTPDMRTIHLPLYASGSSPLCIAPAQTLILYEEGQSLRITSSGSTSMLACLLRY
uniref:Uncharacterized protein n=1 Tax=Avena sativa TaxID=4498 RepID=A0ACD6AIU2_AVESA